MMEFSSSRVRKLHLDGESVYMIILLYFCENWISGEEKLTNLYTANWT